MPNSRAFAEESEKREFLLIY